MRVRKKVFNSQLHEFETEKASSYRLKKEQKNKQTEKVLNE